MFQNPIYEIFLIIILIVFNGIFSAGEMAIVSSRKSKLKNMIKEKKDKKAEALLHMVENPEKFLSSIQIGITIFSILSSVIAGILSVKYIKPYIDKIPVIGDFSETISVIIVVAILTYLFLLFGELVPKYIGINYRERLGVRVVSIFDFVSKVFFLFVNMLTRSTQFIVNILGLKREEEHIGEGEIKILLEEGRKKGIFDKTEEELVHGVFEFADRSVKEIMVPKPNVYSINIDDSKEDIIRYIIENEFSRYPVYKNDLDNIVGVVFYKDVTRQMYSNEPFELANILKKPFFVPDTMEISKLLKEMQRRHMHLAIVVNEYGATVGIVTLEDIMEEIFGEIMDETDRDDRIEKLKDGSFIIDASCTIRDLNNMFRNLNLPESPEYETLGGFLITKLQEIPKGGEMVYHGPYRFTVVGIEERRISKVKVEKITDIKKTP